MSGHYFHYAEAMLSTYSGEILSEMRMMQLIGRYHASIIIENDTDIRQRNGVAQALRFSMK